MRAFVFGKSIEFVCRLFAGDEPLQPISLVSARVYSSYPSTEQITDSSGALADYTGTLITTYAKLTDNRIKIILDAIDDPDPSGLKSYETYYVVVSVRFETSEQIQNIVETIVVWRAAAQVSQLEVEPEDVFEIESSLKSMMTTAQVIEKIDAAKRFILTRIKFLELERTRLSEYDLSSATLCRAIELCCRDFAGQSNDFRAKADYWLTQYEKVWLETKPGYKSSNDSAVEPGDTAQTYKSLTVMR